MDLGLKDKRVLVSAASMGIGRGAAEEFIKEGAKVAICSSTEENISKAAKEIGEKYGTEPLWTVCDINKLEDIEATVNKVKEEFGGIDILVNNCGGPVPGYFEELPEGKWEEAFQQVLMSAVRFTKSVLPMMKEQKWGRIVNVTSQSVKQPVENLILSNSLRSALTAAFKTISNQYGMYGITVNHVAPGFIQTSRLEELAEVRGKKKGISTEEELKQMATEVPMKRIGQPEDMGAIIAFLSSERAGYINGTTIQVDGGIIKSTY